MKWTKVLPLAIAAVCGLSLAGCGSSGTGSGTSNSGSDATTVPAVNMGPAATGTVPSWANPTYLTGTKLVTFTVGQVQVDVYQVATFTASQDSPAVSITAGEPIVLVNYVMTNTGPAIDLDLPPEVTATYTSNPTQSMDSVLNTDLMDSAGVNQRANKDGETGPTFAFATGDVISVGNTFPYLPGGTVTFTGNYSTGGYADMPQATSSPVTLQ